MNAGELCCREVITATRDMSIREAAQLMRDRHVGCLVVVEGSDDRQKPVGILTDRDIVIEIIADNVCVDDVAVGDVMSFALLKVNVQDSIPDTAQRMRARGVRRVPVIEATGELAGILALDDILALLSEEMNLLTRCTAREAEQERKKRA